METLFELGSNLMIILQTLLQTLFLSDAVHRLEMIYTMKSEMDSTQVCLHLWATPAEAGQAGGELPPGGEHHSLDCQHHLHQPDLSGRIRGCLVLGHSHQDVAAALHPLQVNHMII